MMMAGFATVRRFAGILFLLMLAAALSACVDMPASASPEPTVKGIHTLHIALLTNDLGVSPQLCQPMADAVLLKLHALGMVDAQIMAASDVSQLSDWLLSGEADIFLGSVYPSMQLVQTSQAVPILQCWKNGVAAYQAVIFARKDSGVSALEDLPGHLFAMTSPVSSHGFMLPAAVLTEKGLKLTGRPEIASLSASGEVGLIFSGSDETTLQWVLSGQVAAGATDDFHFDVAFPAEAAQQLVVLARTEFLPRCLVVARPGLSPAFVEALQEAFVGLSDTPDGVSALAPSAITRFSAIASPEDEKIRRYLSLAALAGKIPLPPQ